MSIPGGIRVKLALALLGIVGGALFAAYMIVVPSLERRLVAAKLNQLQLDAETLAVRYAGQEAQNRLRLDDFVDGAGFVSNSRVVVFAVRSRTKMFVIVSSSSDESPSDSDSKTT